MQGLSSHAELPATPLKLLWGLHAATPTVKGISEQGVTRLAHMHPDLVSAAGLQAELDIGTRMPKFEDSPMSDGGLPLGTPARKLDTMLRMSPVESSIAARLRQPMIPDERFISPLHLMPADLLREVVMSSLGACDYQEP